MSSDHLDSKYFDASLEPGESRKYRHDACGNVGLGLNVTRTATGWVYHCFRCGLKGFRKARDLSPRETLEYVQKLSARIRQRSRADASTEHDAVELPRDFTLSIPERGLQWITRYGISEDEIRRYRFGYSPSLDRVILPVWEESKCVFWQGRNLGRETPDRPKYLSVKGKDKVYFKISKPRDEGRDALVVVEDILSAVKVGRQFDVIALLGSSIDPAFGLDVDRPVIWWLDADKYIAALGFCRRLKVIYGRKSNVIQTRKDPKEYDEEYIEAIVRGLSHKADAEEG